MNPYHDEFRSPSFEPEWWEPRSASDWIHRDPLGRGEIPILSDFRERDSVSTFNAWTHLPPPLRMQVWREREIAAKLYLMSRDWSQIPHIRYIGVGKRVSNGRRKLTGIVTFESVLPIDTNLIYEQYQIPQSIEVPSDIPEQESLAVSLRVEYTATPGHFRVGLVPPDQFVLTSSSPLPPSAPTLQAGDVIAGENQAGFRTPGTLSAIVSRELDTEPLLLSAAHVLGQRGWKVVANVPVPTSVGRVIELDHNLDAAIAKLQEPWIVDYRIKSINLVPAAPIMPYSDLAVQFVGGMSGHQTGWLDVVNSIPVGAANVGVIPHFRSTIYSQPGDSGALLLSGHGRDTPIPLGFASAMHPQYVESMTCAMLGILVAGPSASLSPTTRPQTYFTPLLSILNRFRLQAWVRTI